MYTYWYPRSSALSHFQYRCLREKDSGVILFQGMLIFKGICHDIGLPAAKIKFTARNLNNIAFSYMIMSYIVFNTNGFIDLFSVEANQTLLLTQTL
jgi:hypothetical protein